MLKFTKQPYEEFYAWGSILRVQQTGESITKADSTVTAVDCDGNDVSSTVLQAATKKVATHPDSENGQTQNVLGIIVQGGTASGSPYKLTFRMATDMAHKWEVDVFMYVEEI